MASQSAYVFGGFLLVLFAAGSFVSGETGCPPAETIAPCTCYDSSSTRLVCSDILQVDVIERVFRNSARYTFQEVHIRFSALQYLPSTLFDNVRINELYIENSTVTEVFYNPPRTSYLEKLQLDNVRIQRRNFFSSGALKQFTSLKTLVVKNYSGSKVIDSTFSQNLPSSLKQITLNGTTIRKIKPGAFDSLRNLDKLEITSSKLNALTRDMFPQLFNARFLYFDNNNISSIPRDLFTDMPDLQFLTMRNNYITEIPETAFGNRRTIPYLRFEGNPLQCNCLLVWLVKNKPEIVGGTCHSPSNLQGRKLQDLLPGDFNC